MSNEPTQVNQNTRPHPAVTMQEDGSLRINCASEQEVAALLGMRTCDAAVGVYKTALNALGKQAEEHCNLVSAMFAELDRCLQPFGNTRRDVDETETRTKKRLKRN